MNDNNPIFVHPYVYKRYLELLAKGKSESEALIQALEEYLPPISKKPA
jgi:hypothetical protein